MTDDELKQLLDSNATETRRHFDSKTAEVRRHFDVSFERMEKRFDALAEVVQLGHERQERTTAALEEKIDRNAIETQAMIKFSHKELDRRLTELEDTVSDLQVRLQRIESGTH
jgi:hypothetical protein